MKRNLQPNEREEASRASVVSSCARRGDRSERSTTSGVTSGCASLGASMIGFDADGLRTARRKSRDEDDSFWRSACLALARVGWFALRSPGALSHMGTGLV